MSSVKSNFLWNSAYQIIRIIIPLILTPYLTRVLGSEQLGISSYTNTIANYAVLFIMLGLGQYGSRTIAKAKHDKELMTKKFWSIYAVQVTSGVLVSLIYVAYVTTVTGELALCSWVWLLIVVAEIVDFNWLFYGLEEFRIITIRNVIVRSLTIVAIFIFVHSSDDTWIYCLISALGAVVSNAIFVAMLPSRIAGFHKPALREVLAHVKPNLTLFAPIITISLYTQLNSVLLGAASTMSDVAFYASAYAVVSIPLALIQSLGQVLLPRLSVLLQEGDDSAAQRYLSTSMWISMAVCFGLLSGIIAVADLFVPTYYGPGYEPCIVILPVVAAMIIPCSISSVTGNQYLIPHEKDGQYFRSVLIGAVVNIALCAALIPMWGALGAAIATVAAEITVAVVQIVFVGNKLPFAKYAKGSLPFLVAAVFEFAAIKLIACAPLPDILLLCLEILGGIVAYGMMSAVLLVIKKDETFKALLKG